jgi:hypothetical protein
MSNQYKDPKEVPIDILCNRLNELAKHCSNGNLSEFYMRIPAECDRDADIVLSESSNRIKAMQAKLNDKDKEIAALRERCRPSRVVLINEAGHYVGESVHDEIIRLRGKINEQAEELARWRNSAKYRNDEILAGNKIIIKQDEELAALRDFASDVISAANLDSEKWIINFAIRDKLIDERGNPTRLLTGNSEQG